MKLYGNEVNRLNYRDYSTSQLDEFRSDLDDNIRMLEEDSHSQDASKQLDVFGLQKLDAMRELVVLVAREISFRSKRNS